MSNLEFESDCVRVDMDPTALISNGSFQSANAASSPYNLSEIWRFPMNGGGLDLRRVQFGQSLSQFADEGNENREGSGNDPIVLNHRGTNNGGARKRRDAASEDESTKNDCGGKRLKSSDDNCDSKTEVEPNSRKPEDQNAKPSEPPKQDYIHVRARRGQATDSHSLAERARREKIGERMKTLQDLVPGCNKVIGKALVLDEIINYVQSLQRQVEFLSMKLEAVNSRTSPDIEGFPSKDFGQQTLDAAGVAFGSQASRDYGKGLSPEWLHMQIGGGFQRTT